MLGAFICDCKSDNSQMQLNIILLHSISISSSAFSSSKFTCRCSKYFSFHNTMLDPGLSIVCLKLCANKGISLV